MKLVLNAMKLVLNAMKLVLNAMKLLLNAMKLVLNAMKLEINIKPTDGCIGGYLLSAPGCFDWPTPSCNLPDSF